MSETAIYISQNPKYEDLIKNGYIEGFLKTTLKALALFSKDKKVSNQFQILGKIAHKEYFLRKSFEIFIRILIPLIKLSSEEKQKILEDPLEVIMLS